VRCDVERPFAGGVCRVAGAHHSLDCPLGYVGHHGLGVGGGWCRGGDDASGYNRTEEHCGELHYWILFKEAGTKSLGLTVCNLRRFRSSCVTLGIGLGIEI
jgi:hypothetical protein